MGIAAEASNIHIFTPDIKSLRCSDEKSAKLYISKAHVNSVTAGSFRISSRCGCEPHKYLQG